MKTTTIAIAALLTIAAPATAFAQQTQLVPGATDPSLETAIEPQGVGTAEFMDEFGAARFTSAGTMTLADIDLDAATSVRVEEVASGAVTGFESLDENELMSLRARIAANASAKAALDAGGWTPERVIGVQGDADGSLILYVSNG